MNILGKRSDLSFSRKSDRKKEKSTVSFMHEKNIICSKTQLDHIGHEKTIICRQLFAGHVDLLFWNISLFLGNKTKFS